MTGEPCEKCGHGWLVVYSSNRCGDKMIRYHHCYLCGHRPAENKTISDAPPQRFTRYGKRPSSPVDPTP